MLPFAIGGISVEISASIGIDVTTAGGSDSETMLRQADVAMYAAKDTGKNRFAVFQREMHDRLVRRVQLERELREAGEVDQLEIHYQPIVDLRTGQIAGVEALMRWLHPDRGLMMPNDFVGVAEETGTIVPLGRILRAKAFAQTRRWIESGVGEGFHLSVNVSPRELEDDEFVKVLLADLERAGLGPEALVVEVTEGMMMRSRVHGVRCLEALRANGVRSAIDDFGTGYSSLSYLQELPAEILKIDRSFVNRLQDSTHSDKGVVAAIIAMGQNLGLTTVAEGVETNEQRELLSALGCELGQGYLFARPAAVAEMDVLLLADRELPLGRARPRRDRVAGGSRRPAGARVVGRKRLG